MHNLKTRYPNNCDAADSSYPLGRPRNNSDEYTKDGFGLEKDWISDREAFFQGLMNRASLTVNGSTDTVSNSQLLTALLESGIIGNDAISDVSLDKLTTGNVALGSSSTIKIGSYGSTHAQYASLTVDPSVGFGAGEDPGTSYIKRTVLSGGGIVFPTDNNGGPGTEPYKARTSVFSATYSDISYDQYGNFIATFNKELSGIPSGTTIYSVSMITYAENDSSAQTYVIPVIPSLAAINSNMAINGVIGIAIQYVTFNTSTKLIVTYDPSLVD